MPDEAPGALLLAMTLRVTNVRLAPLLPRKIPMALLKMVFLEIK